MNAFKMMKNLICFKRSFCILEVMTFIILGFKQFLEEDLNSVCMFKKSTFLGCNWEGGSLEKGETRNLIYYSDSQISCCVYMNSCLSSIKSFFL